MTMPAGQASVCVAPASYSAGRGGARGRRTVHVCARDGVRLAVRERGPQHCAHTVVFLHGFCLASVAWARQIAYLRRRYGGRVRVISYDHRGHGNSDPAPRGSCRIEQLAEDLAVVLDELDVTGSVTLVGHSMGAMVALAYMARKDRRVDPAGLVLVATAAGKLAQRGIGRLLATPAVPAVAALAAHTPASVLTALAGPAVAAVGRWRGCGPAERATVAALAATAVAQTPIATAVGFLTALRDWDQFEVLASITASTVIVSGERDLLTPSVHAEEMAAAIRGAVHVAVPGAGHMLPQQAPLVIDEAIRHVMGRSGRAGGSPGDARGSAAGTYVFAGAEGAI